MYKSRRVAIVLTSILLIVPFGCKNTSSTAEHDGDEGEEADTRFAVDQTCDVIRKGVRLILAYDTVSVAFTGTVENVSDRTVPAVRVEVHLSNGMELGPTPRNDPKPGAKVAVKLSAQRPALVSTATNAAANTRMNTAPNIQVSIAANIQVSIAANIIDMRQPHTRQLG